MCVVGGTGFSGCKRERLIWPRSAGVWARSGGAKSAVPFVAFVERGGTAGGMRDGRRRRTARASVDAGRHERLRQVQQPPQAAQMLKVAFSDLCEQESRGRR